MNKTAAALLYGSLVGLTRSVATADAGRFVDLQIYPASMCAGSDFSNARLSWSRTYGGPEMPVEKEMPAGRSAFRFEAPQEHFWLNVVVGKCRDLLPVTIIEGHQRNLLAFPTYPLIHVIDARGWIAGSLPRGVANVELRRANDGRLLSSAMIDAGAYYFEFVGQGRYMLRYEVAPGNLINRPVDLSKIQSDGGKRLDLSLSDLLRAVNGTSGHR